MRPPQRTGSSETTMPNPKLCILMECVEGVWRATSFDEVGQVVVVSARNKDQARRKCIERTAEELCITIHPNTYIEVVEVA